jgi:hypothetical protein
VSACGGCGLIVLAIIISELRIKTRRDPATPTLQQTLNEQ